jgi:hypothetical protein
MAIMKLSDLRSAEEIHQEDMANDPEYRREYQRTRLANQVAIEVIRWRTERGATQAKLAKLLGMRQPNIARLESGEHVPTLDTLQLLSAKLGMNFTIDVDPQAGASLRQAERLPGPVPSGIATPTVVMHETEDQPGTERGGQGDEQGGSLQAAPSASNRRRQGRGGKFVLKKGSTGKFHFNLVAGNGQVIATSEMYESKRSALNGIKSIKTDAPTAEIDSAEL